MKARFSTETGRLEAFSDGVLAVIITIMVLDLHAPRDPSFRALSEVVPTFLAYALSFVYIGIYWNNHHHMLRASEGIDGRAMWSNLHLLFWLSLVPFTTAWLGVNFLASAPTAVYGIVLLLCGFAYSILQHALSNLNGPDTAFAKAIQRDLKGNASLVLYACGVAISFFAPLVADALYITVAVIWFVPDRRFERVIAEHEKR